MAEHRGPAINSKYAQTRIGIYYLEGKGVVADKIKGVNWITLAAESGSAEAQRILGDCYDKGDGVVENPVESHKWILLAAANGDQSAKTIAEEHKSRFSNYEILEGRRLAQNWIPKKLRCDDNPAEKNRPKNDGGFTESRSTGSGFFITQNGYLVTNNHVVQGCNKVRVQTSSGLLDAKVVRVDNTSDLALLKVTGAFNPLPIVSSRSVRLGATVATVGFPNVGLQGFEPKLSRGDISSLAGIQDDVRYFQISVPVQPGNSGGALVDDRGNVVGVVTAQLSQEAALESSGALAQNVNYAIKSSYLLSFLESVPEAAEGITDAKSDEQKFESIVDEIKQASVLIIGY